MTAGPVQRAASNTPDPPDALRRRCAGRRVTVRDLAAAKARNEKWPMLTAYDALTARIFDEAGIPVLLVGDSAAMVVYGHDSTIPVTVDDLIPLTAAVVRGTSRALVVADLPFGSYQVSVETAMRSAIRFLKETGAHAVKLEGGHRVLQMRRGARRRRHPGHGAPRPDAAVGERVRRLPGAGQGRGGRAADAGREGAAGGWRVRGRA